MIDDNDETPHGPIEKLVQPYVESGHVTYRWWPMKDCYVQYGGWKGFRKTLGQQAATEGALNRFGDSTRYFASMDVDEFFVIPNQTVWEWIQTKERNEANATKTDAFAFIPTQMAPCNGTIVSKNQSVIEK